MNKNLKLLLFVVGCASFPASAPFSWFRRAKSPWEVTGVRVSENPLFPAEKVNQAALERNKIKIEELEKDAKTMTETSRRLVEDANHSHDGERHDLLINKAFAHRGKAFAKTAKAESLHRENNQRAAAQRKFVALKSAGRTWARK